MRTPLIALVVMASAGLAMAQVVENAGFGRGKTGWTGDGKIVYFNPDGTVSETAVMGAPTGLRIDLNRNGWKEIKQKLRPKPGEKQVSISFQAMAEPGFQRLEESKQYSVDINWKEGSQWIWTSLIRPKCDLLIRMQHDEAWYYRPLSLQPVGSWVQVSQTIEDLMGKQREISILLPPGTGTVLIKAAAD